MKLLSQKKLSTLEKICFAKHLSMFLKSGITLSESLRALAEEGEKSAVGFCAQRANIQIENGQPLHVAFKKQPESFDPFFCGIVEIGEASGTLEKSLGYLAQKLEREAALRKKIKGMLYYPAVVISASVLVGAFVSFFVLPKMGQLFHSFNVKLPLSTRILLEFSDITKNYGIIMLVLLGGLFFAFRLLLSIWPKFKYVWHKARFHIPIFGKVSTCAAFSAFFRNLSIMLRSGLTLEHALKTQAKISENLILKEVAENLRRNVIQGKKISEALASPKNPVFPTLVARMISAGEASGKLEESFAYLADFFEDETEAHSKSAAVILEPALLIFIGAIVAFIALSIILPIYSLTGSIHR